jgi:very-short-patch-repair endonuclease
VLGAQTQTAHRAKRLRRALSPPEALLWTHLRRRPAGLKFRRQHPCGPWIADFFCSEARLVIEVDGSSHAAPDAALRDAGRDRWFADHGIATLRVSGAAVLADGIGTAAAITQAALARVRDLGGAASVVTGRPSTTRFAGGPPPPVGEDDPAPPFPSPTHPPRHGEGDRAPQVRGGGARAIPEHSPLNTIARPAQKAK